MYKSITIRRMKDPEIRDLMRQVNQIELALKHIKSHIKTKQAFHKYLKNFKDPVTQKDVDKIFKQE